MPYHLIFLIFTALLLSGCDNKIKAKPVKTTVMNQKKVNFSKKLNPFLINAVSPAIPATTHHANQSLALLKVLIEAGAKIWSMMPHDSLLLMLRDFLSMHKIHKSGERKIFTV